MGLVNRNNILHCRHGGFQRDEMANFRTAMIAAAAVAAMATSQSLAADGSLAPGKPAGVREAVRHSPSLWLIGGAAAVAVVAVVVATQSTSNAVCGTACNVPTSSTSTTS